MRCERNIATDLEPRLPTITPLFSHPYIRAMATLIPTTDVESIDNHGERLVATALKACFDNKTLVYHSFPWLRPKQLDNSPRTPLQPGEIDFVVMHPEYGLLVLEVKGGDIELREDGSAVVHKGRAIHTLKESPFTQVHRNYQNLKGLFFEHPYFKPQGGEKRLLPFNSGFAVAFPTHKYTWDLPATDGDPKIVIDATGIDDIEKSIKRALEAWAGGPVRLSPSEADLQHSKEVMQREFRLLPALWRTLEEQEEQLKRLTNEQYHLLGMLNNRRYAAIEGVAGSGKTMVAMHQVERLAKGENGLRTLFVCYNRPLADWLNGQLQPELRETVTIATYHQLCTQWCKKANIPFAPNSVPKEERQDYWDYEAPELLENAATIIPDENKFQAVIVDEGQDFRPTWWDSIEQVFSTREENPYFFVFYDPRQNLFIEKPCLPPSLGDAYILPTNCRNTKRIAHHCAEIIETEIETRPESPQGAKPIIKTTNNLASAIRAACKQVGQWVTPSDGNLRPNQIALLTGPGTDNKQWPDKVGNIPFVEDFDKWRAGEGILRCSWRRFKGLEADAIVLAENQRKDLSSADRYVATSRAKHLLTVVSIQN